MNITTLCNLKADNPPVVPTITTKDNKNIDLPSIVNNYIPCLHRENQTAFNQQVGATKNIDIVPMQDTIPIITLPDKTSVKNYSYSNNFVLLMEKMSLKEATEIQNKIKKYPQFYPMPCMALTAAAIYKSLEQLFREFFLTEEEQNILHKFKQMLNDLAPTYPYEQSLILTYKFLLYKSFFDFKFQMEALELNKHQKASFSTSRMIDFLKSTGIERLTGFHDSTSLQNIQELPWNDLLSNNQNFKDKLEEIYESSLIFNILLRWLLPVFESFCLNEILIPYINPLDIDFFNKTWPLPLWLISCSVFSEYTDADGFQLSASGFFEHDLYHLSLKLINHNENSLYYKPLLFWLRQLYQHQDSIKSVKFTAIELALFSTLHENIVYIKDINQQFKSIINSSCSFGVEGLPKKYNLTTYTDIKKAAKWLIKIPIGIYSDDEFNNLLVDAESNVNYSNGIMLPNKEDDTLSIEFSMPDYMQEMIEIIKCNKDMLYKNKMNPSKVIGFVREYSKNYLVVNTTQLESNDKKYFISWLGLDPAKEAKWIISFLNTDNTLSSAERCKKTCKEIRKMYSPKV